MAQPATNLTGQNQGPHVKPERLLSRFQKCGRVIKGKVEFVEVDGSTIYDLDQSSGEFIKRKTDTKGTIVC